jgi:hypothetical protein
MGLRDAGVSVFSLGPKPRQSNHNGNSTYREGGSKLNAFCKGIRLLSGIFTCAKFREGGHASG